MISINLRVLSARVDIACKIVAVADMVFGVAVLFTLGYHLLYREIEILRFNFPRENDNYWLMFACGPIQFGLGILLYRAISLDDEDLCRLWQCLNLPLIYFAFPVYVRAVFIVVVEEFFEPEEDGTSNDDSQVGASGIKTIEDPPPKYEPPPPYHVAITMQPA